MKYFSFNKIGVLLLICLLVATSFSFAAAAGSTPMASDRVNATGK